MKKFNEKVIINYGKLMYAIEVTSGNDKERSSYITIRDGKVYFENGYFNSISVFDSSDETHQIAKDIFMTQLRVDVKTRISELKLLESVLTELGLVEVLGDTLLKSQRILIETQVNEQMKELKEETGQIVEEKIVEMVKPRVIKKGVN